MRKIVLILFYFQIILLSQTRTVGLILNDTTKALKGYTLFSPISSTTTYLIDINGNKIQSWNSSYRPGQAVMLLSNGDLLRTATPIGMNLPLNGGGAGGIVEKYNWDGNLIWSFSHYNSEYRTHHDVEILPNGNILLIAWVKKTKDEAISVGRTNIPANVSEIWSEKIIEVKPSGTNIGTIVWEWHAWDHIVQDVDATKLNFDTVSKRLELININSAGTQTDWLHINSIRYNSKLDQILLSIHNSSEIWIIDHSTTTQQAASHTGGKGGKGGDLLYRWGNPKTYNRGTTSDQKLYLQHDARWIDSGYVGSGNILIFNNGQGRPGGNYSTIEEITPPITTDGKYTITSNSPFGPSIATWNYTASTPTQFYGQNISGATRLPNGNTLACVGPSGTFIEISYDKNIVWKYISPVTQSGIIYQGQSPTNNMVFKIYRYAPDYSAFTGRTLTSKGPIELYANNVNNENETPSSFRLEQNYPNPFNPSTIISYQVPINNFVSLKIYDVLGKEIKTLVNKNQEAGYYKVDFDGSNLQSGIYFYQLKAGSFIEIKKMLLVK